MNKTPSTAAGRRRTIVRSLWLLATSLWVAASASGIGRAAELEVVWDFPGGSARVEKINQQTRTVRIVPAGDEQRGWVCWWHFKLTGIEPGETITLNVGGGVWATPDQAAFSLDGHTWRQTEPGKRARQRIVYRQRIDAHEAHFAWGPPFVLQDAHALVEEATRRSPYATAFELCTSREGRPVPGIRVSQPGGDGDPQRRAVWVQARQHAWESGASWVCRGFVEWLVSDDPRAEMLRSTTDLTIIPIMDVDNVETGDGGKQQQPHDHNRDWSKEPVFPAVAAAIDELRELHAAGRFVAFIDLHNPAAGNRQPFFFVTPDELLSPRGRVDLERFIAAAAVEINGPLPLDTKPRPTGAKYDPLWEHISKNWVARHTAGDTLAVTLETAWNTPHSNQAGYRQVGRQLGLALERWLRQPPR